jgi:hypothetical protein
LAENAQEFIFVHIPKKNMGDNPLRQKKLAVPLFFKVLRLCVVMVKRAGVSLFNVIFVLKEKGELTLLLTVY